LLAGGDVGIEKVAKTGNAAEGAICLTKQEQKLIEILRNLDYGELLITVKAGMPVHVEEIKKSIKL